MPRSIAGSSKWSSLYGYRRDNPLMESMSGLFMSPGTALRRRKATPHTSSGPLRRWCQRRAWDFPEPEMPVTTTNFVPGNLYGDVLQVVLPCALDDKILLLHGEGRLKGHLKG